MNDDFDDFDDFDEAVSRCQLFRSVDLAKVGPLLRNCEVCTLAPQDVLIQAGAPNRKLFLVLSGELSVRLDSPHSAPLVRITAGESCGELSVIDNQPASAFVVAETESRILALDEELMWMLVNTSHAVSSNLLFTLSQRLRHGNAVITSDREQIREFRFHATIDALTGIFNRNWLDQMLPRQMERCRSSGQPMSLLMIDIDYFKQFNDSHGHVGGDRALCTVAATLRDNLRPADMAARYGGEEFSILLPNAPLETAKNVATRLCRSVREAEIEFENGEKLPSVTISVGVAEMLDTTDRHEFIGAADSALYRAKRSGRDRAEW